MKTMSRVYVQEALLSEDHETVNPLRRGFFVETQYDNIDLTKLTKHINKTKSLKYEDFVVVELDNDNTIAYLRFVCKKPTLNIDIAKQL